MPNKEPTSDDEGGRKFFIWNKFSLSYSMRASHFPAHEDYIMTNKLTKAGEQFMVGEDATMVVTDQENRITKTETDFVLVEQTPEPNKVLGFDNSAVLKQFNLSAQGEELLRAILPGNSFVIVDNEGHISVVSMDSGTGNLPITGGKLTGQLTIESTGAQLIIKKKVAADTVAIDGHDENMLQLFRIIYEAAGNLTIKNMIAGGKLVLNSDGTTTIASSNNTALDVNNDGYAYTNKLKVTNDIVAGLLTLTGADYLIKTGENISGDDKSVFGTSLRGANNEYAVYERLEKAGELVRHVTHVTVAGTNKYFTSDSNGDFSAPNVVKAGGQVKAGNGSGILETNGNITGSIWGTNLSTYILTNFVQAVQYSSQRRIGLSNEDEIYVASGEVMSGIDNWKSGTSGFEGFYAKMTQVKVNNVWVNIAG